MNLSSVIQELTLSLDQLGQVRDALTERIMEGITCSGAEIAALPAYLPRPERAPQGQVLVIDIGGTNVRAALVEMDQGQARIVDGPVQSQVETGREHPVSAEQFFRSQAELASQLKVPPLTPVGYCFSYPAATTSDVDAKLLAWTKGIRIPDVVGTAVGARLRRELKEQGMQPGRLVVLNDTVAALLAGVSECGADFDRFIGLIAGTGYNMAGFMPTCKVTKLDPREYRSDEIAINLEAGNFRPPFATVWDDMLDAASDNPERQRFEKASSGFYLPFLYQTIARDIGLPLDGFDPMLGTGHLLKLALEQKDELAQAVLNRSARLIAAATAGFMQAMGPGRCAITVEGSRFWKDPTMVFSFAPLIEKLCHSDQKFQVCRVEYANLFGAACAALS